MIEVQREYLWDMTVPTDLAKSFNCKYTVKADRDLVSAVSETERGYIMVQLEQYGFDEEVLVIVMPHGEFIDHSTNNDEYSSTRMYRSTFG